MTFRSGMENAQKYWGYETAQVMGFMELWYE
jgi:hypothetical protein